MDTKTYLSRYLITLDQYGQPIKVRRDGNATTYKAFDQSSSREVALEIIPAGSVRLSVQSKLEAEAEAAKKVQQMNIPMLYEFGIENNELVYAMEMVDGVTAEDWVKTHGPMPLGSALRIGSQLVKALQAATFHGIFHHALNPGNVMIVPGQTAEGEWPLIKVMKFFGLAPTYTSAQASAAGVSEDVNFIAPEQLETGSADFRTEVYSLGCTLWFLLSGVPPLAGAATVESASRVPAPVRRLLAQMLAIDPRERHFDPVALHGQIEDCIAEVENRRIVPPPKAVVKPAAMAAAAAAPAATTPMIDPRPRRPFPWQPLAVAAVLLAFAGVAIAILPGAFRGRTAAQEPIGVPVGVPEAGASVAPAPASNTAAPAIAAATAAPVKTASNAQIAAAPPGVLTSTAGAGENDADTSTSDADAAPDTGADTARVASNTATAAPQTTTSAAAMQPAPASQGVAGTIASNTSMPAQIDEPSPPSEGPTEENSSRPAGSNAAGSYANVSPDGNVPTTYANNSPDGNVPAADASTASNIASSPRAATRSREPARTETRPREKTKAVAKAEKPAPKKERVVAAAPLPEGRVRAEFLGTTPQGELIFGLPSDQRGYLTPPAPRRERSSRKAKRNKVLPAEPADELPVLPALPADG